MKKEEILQKSRLENKNGDERQHFLAEQSYTISFAILAAVLLVISILSRFNFITGTIHIAKASYTLYEFTLFLLLILDEGSSIISSSSLIFNIESISFSSLYSINL